jgi:membrane-bound lytic murein transglycosylase D
MRNILLIIFYILINHLVAGQAPRVPSVIQFADMELRLNDRAREEIQLDVNSLTRSEKYFNIKLERVIQYFPIIERILEEENVPDDFKYLVIQESALIPDAVSTSNAVGFWQFKKSSGEEVGLRIDRYVDERMNIVSATRGAAKYLKTNNFYYNNWLYSLIAYNTGRGGAEAHINRRHFGDKTMDINKHTHWYVKKYLAHKIAFQDGLSRNSIHTKSLYEYREGGGKSLSQIAADLNVNPDELLSYNKWVRRGKIPTDKIYTVVVPGEDQPTGLTVQSVKGNGTHISVPEKGRYPIIKKSVNTDSRILLVNGIPGTLAKSGDDINSLADLGKIPLKNFLRYNDIDISHKAIPDQVYYFKKKKNKAREHYHTVYPGENSWNISQKYGIKEKKLLRKNRIRTDHKDFQTGRIVWMRFIRPPDQPVEFVEIPRETVVTTYTQTDISSSPDEPLRDTDLVEEPHENKDDSSDDYIETHFGQDKKDPADNSPAEGFSEISDGEGIYRNPSFNSMEDGLPLFHIVEAGETLYGISRKYSISIENIRNINDLGFDEKLQIGQKIYLKNPFPSETLSDLQNNNEKNEDNSYIIYHVKKGETLYGISRKFEVTIDEILDWNSKNDYSIQEGDLLKIKQ